MESRGDCKTRHVLPRWRSVETSIRLGEAGPTLKSNDMQSVVIAPSQLDIAKSNFALNRYAPFAAELLSNAMLLGDLEAAQDAINFLQKDGSLSPISQAIIEDLIEPSSKGHAGETPSTVIRAFRSSINHNLRDPIAWLDIGLAYASLGLYVKSEKALRTAQYLAPTNRLVLRASARLHQHLGDEDIAIRTLHKTGGQLLQDPWLLAPEIGLTHLSGRSSKHIKRAFALLQSGNVSPFHASELASALASLELEHGNVKKAKKLFRAATEDPSETSAAHAVWASQQHKNILQMPSKRVVRCSHEGRARSAAVSGDWVEAGLAANDWLADEPFSSVPALFASSFRSGFLEEYDDAINIIKKSLLANPKHPMLHNNLAYALASSGRVEDAFYAITRIDRHELQNNADTNLFVTATCGLIAFRAGYTLEGLKLYKMAIEKAKNIGSRSVGVKAMIFLSREMRLAGMSGYEEYENIAKKYIDASKDKESKALFDVHINKKKLSRFKMIIPDDVRERIKFKLPELLGG